MIVNLRRFVQETVHSKLIRRTICVNLDQQWFWVSSCR